MKNDNDIIHLDTGPAPIQRYNGDNPIGAMLNAVVEKGVTAENAAVMKEIVGLYERMEDRGAKQAYTAAMTAMQAELPKVVAKRFIPDNNGKARSWFADYGSIMEVIEPFLTKYGFSVSFTVRYDEHRLIAVCRMKHAGGHEETNEFGVRIGKGPPGCSEAQADGSARSYARRGALCDALNIVVDHDDDARADGAKITQEQADALRARAKEVGADEVRLLRFANAETFEDIRSAKYAAVDAFLIQKKKTVDTQKPPPGRTAQVKPQYDRDGNPVDPSIDEVLSKAQPIVRK